MLRDASVDASDQSAVGRPYATELAELAPTYQWALAADIRLLADSIRRTASLPLLAIGSGGSLSVAEFAAGLHRDLSGCSAIAQTPLDAVASRTNLRNAAVLLTSARGSNPDVLASFDRLVRREPRSLIVVCLKPRAPLARRASRIPFVDLIELSPPTRRDGFLATNSLITLVALLERAYGVTFGDGSELPSKWEQLLPHDGQIDLDRRLAPAWKKQTLIVLYGPSTRVAAVDLESRLSEAALQNISTADYRNFAHGRHNWLAKRPDSTAVLAFVTPADREIASKTIDLVPKSVPTISVNIPFTGATAAVAALARVMHIALSAGQARGIDPGRPGVPPFGRQIYHLNAFKQRLVSDRRAIAIERKIQKPIEVLSRLELLGFWRRAYSTFTSGLQRTTFRGVVVDYDGTLSDDRFGGLTAKVTRELVRLVNANIPLAVATGRGKSVRKSLRDVVPMAYWDRVVIGYYNGGDIGLLSEDKPDPTERAGAALSEIAAVLRKHRLLARLATLEFRIPQLSVEPKQQVHADDVWTIVNETVQTLGKPGTVALRSSHSIDVLGPQADKRAVIRRLQELDGAVGAPVLCIGDKGRYPGNDFFLLSEPHALSVNEVSADPTTCWNIAPVGVRGVAACIHYLRGVRTTQRGARLDSSVWRAGQ